MILIRHGKTYGNTLGRYIGTTDEPLCEEGRQSLLKKSYPEAEKVYVSPLKRCKETAELIYPNLKLLNPKEIPLLRECDFGDFENKNYQELSSNPKYQAWVDSHGQLPFPGGESHEAFKKRCKEGFRQVIEDAWSTRQQAAEETSAVSYGMQFDKQNKKQAERFWKIALVVHGGTIMSILEAFSEPKESFYHWQVKNGEGFTALLDEELYEAAGTIRLYQIARINVPPA